MRRESRVLFERTWEPRGNDYVALFRKAGAAADAPLDARDVVAFGVDQMGAFHAIIWADEYADFAAADELPGLISIERVSDDDAGDGGQPHAPPELEPPSGPGWTGLGMPSLERETVPAGDEDDQ